MQLKSYLNAFGVNNDLGLVNKTDDAHFPRALGAEERICFVHLSDELRPALERLTPGFMGAFGAE